MRGTAAHRKDIDGLRAVAILPVLFYHANIWPFSAGYVGVDIFFVLSGYLITGLILREQAGAGFSLRTFYDRRVRRILPALFVVLALTTLAALFVLLSDELVIFGGSLLGAVLFYANILYWTRDAAYFASDANQNPLLHIWSLSVEEQFYLFWPLLLVAMARLRRALPLIILGLAVASLASAVVLADTDGNAAFYLLPSRAWQLLIGALLATGRFEPPAGMGWRNGIAFSGLLLIAGAMLFPGDPSRYHPANAISAAFGTAAILFAAESGANRVSSMLSTRVPVFIGLISYSLYLWHWPALVFARLCLNRDLTVLESGCALVGTFALSVVSWRFVEQPFRRWRGRWGGLPASIPVAAGIGALLVAVAVLAITTGGFPSRLPPDVRHLVAEASAPLPGGWCQVGDDCINGNPRLKGEVVLWGDSHARMLGPVVGSFAAVRHLRLRQLTRPSCPPLPDLSVVAPNGESYGRCTAVNRAALDAILRNPRVKLVVLEARWEVYLNEFRIRPAHDQMAQMNASLDKVLAMLTGHGIPVLIIGNVPLFADIPAHCFGRQHWLGGDTSRCLSLPLADVRGVIGVSDIQLEDAAARYRNVRAFFPRVALCDAKSCPAFSAGQLLYGDTHHLTPDGAARVGQALDAALRNWPR